MPACSFSRFTDPSSFKWFERFVKGTDIGRSVRGEFRETGTAPTRKGSAAKATTVEKYILNIKAVTRRGARILGRR
jgi:hypothetical protein